MAAPILPPTSLVVRAAAFAAERHVDQRRKVGDAPYVNHPLRVARNVAEVAGCEDAEVLAAAMLHDTVEDTGTTAAELRAAFTDRVAELVLEVTDDKSKTKVERKKHQIVHAAELSPGASLIKLADKLDNLTDLTTQAPASWTPERVRGYFVWARHVVDAVAHPDRGLRSRLDALFVGELASAPGVPAVPDDPDERRALLEAYYGSLS